MYLHFFLKYSNHFKNKSVKALGLILTRIQTYVVPNIEKLYPWKSALVQQT